MYTKINNILEKYITPVHINKKNNSEKVDLEIFIHVKDSFSGRMGHADLYFENTVYSYGCYDEASKRLFETIGDGTLIKIKSKNKYLKFCTHKSNKIIFSFGTKIKK